MTLTVDFNGAYDAATAIKVIESLVPQGLAMVEQPVPGNDLKGMAAVTQAVEPVVLADQAVEVFERSFSGCRRKRRESGQHQAP